METMTIQPQRYLGLDVHKHYLVAAGVNAARQAVHGPQRVALAHLERWLRTTVTPQDAVVLEMTGNSYQLYDELLPHAHSVTVVHPPHVKLITSVPVMNDKIAAFRLAELHAVGLLTGIWVPPLAVRELRALIAQRRKMVRLATQAKNRLHAVIHRYHLQPPEGDICAACHQAWWQTLTLTPVEQVRIQCDLSTLTYAQTQSAQLEALLAELAATDERVIFLVQLPGVGLLTAMTILAAIGDIARFPDAAHLVGYAGMGSRVHESGQLHRHGGLIKAGRRDLRSAMVEAAHTAARTHPHWQALLARLEPRLGYNKAIVVIARKLLVAVWHVLTEHCADRFADPALVARKFLTYAEQLGQARRPAGQTRATFVRAQLDRLGLGAELRAIQRGQRVLELPPSQLP